MNDDFEVIYYYVLYNELYYAHIATGHIGRHHIIYEVNSINKDFNIKSIYIGKNYHRIRKIYNFGLLQSLIINPKIYQNSLVKSRNAKIIWGLTKQ
jgi:hypothetical protein